MFSISEHINDGYTERAESDKTSRVLNYQRSIHGDIINGEAHPFPIHKLFYCKLFSWVTSILDIVPNYICSCSIQLIIRSVHFPLLAQINNSWKVVYHTIFYTLRTQPCWIGSLTLKTELEWNERSKYIYKWAEVKIRSLKFGTMVGLNVVANWGGKC